MRTSPSLWNGLRAEIPRFVEVLTEFRPPSLHGRSLRQVMNLPLRQPARLSALLTDWRAEPSRMYQTAPSLTFAVLGQARIDGQLTPEEESTILAKLLDPLGVEDHAGYVVLLRLTR